MTAMRITCRESCREKRRKVEVKSGCNSGLIRVFNEVDVSRLRNMFTALVVGVLPFTNLDEM
jgi:hypothetical protein